MLLNFAFHSIHHNLWFFSPPLLTSASLVDSNSIPHDSLRPLSFLYGSFCAKASPWHPPLFFLQVFFPSLILNWDFSRWKNMLIRQPIKYLFWFWPLLSLNKFCLFCQRRFAACFSSAIIRGELSFSFCSQVLSHNHPSPWLSRTTRPKFSRSQHSNYILLISEILKF